MATDDSAVNAHNWSAGPVLPLDARRAYFQFLTHLRKAHQVGLTWPVRTFTEFGTGTSLAICFCALFAGAKQYQGFDLLRHVDLKSQSKILDGIRALYAERGPALNDNGQIAFEFPRDIIPESVLVDTMSDDFYEDIKKNVETLAKGDQSEQIAYHAPYKEQIKGYFGSSDLIISTATLEHVDELEDLYSSFWSLLRSGGMMSHSIDLRSHGYLKPWNGEKLWNGHWLLDDIEWASITEGQAFSINRLPASQHLKMIVEQGFDLLFVQKRKFENKLAWKDLTRQFAWLPAEDIECSGLHAIAIKSIE